MKSPSASPEGIPSLAERFDEQKKVLLSVSTDTEQEFVAFGREVGALSARSKELLAQVNNVLETSTGQSAQLAVELFEELVSAAGQLIGDDESEINSLMREMSEVRHEMSRMLALRMTMEQKVRLPLFLLKVGFRVESAHTNGRMMKVLEGVAMDISTLREQLTNSADEQFAGLQVAVRSMEKLFASLANMSHQARQEHGEAGAQIQELKQHAAHLKEARQSQNLVAQKVAGSSRSLHQQFNRVVVALQYHDITRQQLEHVGQAFDTMGEWLPAPGSGEATGPEAALLQEASRLQAQQTHSTLKTLRTAGQEFQEGMEAISQGASKLAADVAAFGDLCKNEPVFQALDRLATLQAYIAARSELKREIGEAACAIYGGVKDCTQELRELTFDLRLLAINAQVQAANADQRLVVEVLAENICQVSGAIQEATQTLASEMEKIMTQLSALGTRAWVLGTQSSTAKRTVADGVPCCIASLKELQTNVGLGLKSINLGQEEFRQRIEQLLPTVTFPTVASQRLETVVSFFEELEEQTRPAVNGSNAKRDVLASFAASYTMASEREVHASATQKEPVLNGSVSNGANLVDVELFDTPAGVAASGTAIPDQTAPEEGVPGEGLGTNVELF